MLDWKSAEAPAIADIEDLAREAIAGLPPEFAGPAAQVVLRIEDFASDEFLDELEIDDPLELTGLYDGVPMTEKSASDPQHFPDTVWLFPNQGLGLLLWHGACPTEDEAGSDALRSQQWREVGLGAQILRDLGVASIVNLASSTRAFVGLSGFGIEIAETAPLE